MERIKHRKVRLVVPTKILQIRHNVALGLVIGFALFYLPYVRCLPMSRRVIFDLASL